MTAHLMTAEEVVTTYLLGISPRKFKANAGPGKDFPPHFKTLAGKPMWLSTDIERIVETGRHATARPNLSVISCHVKRSR